MKATSIFEDIEANNNLDNTLNCQNSNQNEMCNLISENSAKDSQIDLAKKLVSIGSLKCFYFVKGEPLIVIGPHWPFFLSLFSINIIVVILLFTFLFDKVNGFVLSFGIIIAITQLASYAFTALSNPGIPKSCLNNLFFNQKKNMRICRDCNFLIETGLNTFHCYECNICIEGFDHHCPWTSKCIGRGNLKQFYFFIAVTLLLFTYLIISVSLINPTSKIN